MLLGTKKIGQLEDNLGAVDVVFTQEELAQLNEVGALSAEYPGWMLDFWSGARAEQLRGSRS